MTDRVVVLGAGGFVGQHLVSQLLADGKQVVALVRQNTSNFPPEVQVLTGDFQHPDSFADSLNNASAIVHAASYSTPLKTAGRPADELNLNLRPSLAMLETLQRFPSCRLIYLSSGGTLYGETTDEPAREESPLRPHSYYGAGKAAVEQFIHAASKQFDLDATILRPSNLYGPGQRPREGFGIIPTAFDHIDRNIQLPLRGGGKAIRDYLFIDDFIRLIRSILATPSSPGASTFNAASGQGVSLSDLLNTIRHVTGAPLPVRTDSSKSIDVSRVELDPSRAEQCLGWRARKNLKDGLTETWDWWRGKP